MAAAALPRILTRRWRGRRDERGSVTLELVVIFPVVLIIIFSVVQGALYYHARNVALSAAQEGARTARAEQGTATAGAQQARSFVSDAGGNNILTHLKVTPSRSATEASITVTGRSLSVLPGLPGLPVSQTATQPVERLTTPGGP